LPTTNSFLDFLAEQFSPLGEITSRSMFGGHCLYCDGTVFALVAENEVYLKVDKETKAVFEAAGLKAFKPFPDKDGVMNYFQAPPAIFESSDALAHWGGLAIAAGKRGKKPARQRTKR
jgi:DNA transformation protein